MRKAKDKKDDNDTKSKRGAPCKKASKHISLLSVVFELASDRASSISFPHQDVLLARCLVATGHAIEEHHHLKRQGNA
jgi:hypothetical protein